MNGVHMQAVLSLGFGFPVWGRTVFNLVAVLVSAGLAALVFQVDHPGSALALCFVLPFALVMTDWIGQSRPLHAHLLPAMAGLSLAGVALEPGLLNVALTWVLLAATAISTRGSQAILGLPVMAAVVRLLGSIPLLVFRDGMGTARVTCSTAKHVPRPALSSIILPIVAVTVFTLLLAMANPVIEDLVLALHFDKPWQLLTEIVEKIFSWGGFVFILTALLFWPVLRGQTLLRDTVDVLEGPVPLWHRLFFRPATVAVTLLLLNLLFATENALDIWHVWMKAALPSDMTHAAYVHRGSYTLIATAVLAGVLMVFALWKGTATEQSPLVRLLIYLWTAQNLLLVASSAKRTLSYIDAYGWTEWRLAGLLWMGLVFFGLASIIWRVSTGRDTRWLVNVNMLAATVLLVVSAMIDMRGFIAEKNLQIARDHPGRQIDFDYLQRLGPSSITPLKDFAAIRQRDVESSSRPIKSSGALLDASYAVGAARILSWQNDVINQDWRSWTWRFSETSIGNTP
jgi:Domain of unknown function (DUF4173)